MTAEVPGVEVASEAVASGERWTDIRSAYFPEAGEFIETPVMARRDLAPGETFPGPAIIEESESTLIVGPGAEIRVDDDYNLIVDLPEEGQ